MKDTRISIRLTAEEHTALKILAAKQHKKMQQLMIDFIRELIKAETQNEKN